jgi:inorganic pyrophosphatase
MDPVRLKPLVGKGKDKSVQVLVETPKGSRNKYALDPGQGVFELKWVLPAGMDFPYDFGFVPSTIADDGDPIDVLLLIDESAFPGCLVRSRLIGVIKGEQDAAGTKTERNDRLLAVAQRSRLYGHITDIDQLEDSFLKELTDFFVDFHRLEGKRFRPVGNGGPGEARKLLKQAIKKAKD